MMLNWSERVANKMKELKEREELDREVVDTLFQYLSDATRHPISVKRDPDSDHLTALFMDREVFSFSVIEGIITVFPRKVCFTEIEAALDHMAELMARVVSLWEYNQLQTD